MNEFQNKVGGGLNKIQGSLQQGKQKIQLAQEINQGQQAITALRQKRQELIFQLGDQIHRKLRLTEIDIPEFKTISSSIESIDKEVYQQSKSIEALKASSQSNYICGSCNGEVNPTDKFCGSCGTPVVIQDATVEDQKNCLKCKEDIPDSAAFCPCCGHATAAVREESYVL